MSAAEHEAAIGRLLAELGALTADGIADLMRTKGIKGYRKDGGCCPIAVLIATEVTYLPELEVGNTHVYPHGSVAPDDEEPPALPGSAQMFVSRFDAGVYLDLVEVAG